MRTFNNNLFCLVICALLNCVQCLLDVSCNYVSSDKKITCRCYSNSDSSNSWEELSTLIENYVNDRRISNIDFSHVVLKECDNVMIEVDFGSLNSLSTQSVMFVSFLEINNLHVYLSNVDSGTKTLVSEDIDTLRVSGRLSASSSTMRFFLRNPRINNADITFDDFYSTETPISLMNVQDVDSFTVTDKTSFESVIKSEFVRVDRCLKGSNSISCNNNSGLFSSNSGLELKEIVLITGIVLLIVAIIIGIGIGLYIRRWRKKNDLELLGYPPKVPPPRSNLSSDISRSKNSSNGFTMGKTRNGIGI